MTKKEIIWREILNEFFQKKTYRFTQKDLAYQFKISLSTVFNALKVPRASGVIEVKGRFFLLRDAEKFLHIWATFRNLSKEIVYQTHVEDTIHHIEGQLTPDSILTGYSAYKKHFNDSPADYDKVYVYSQNLEELKKRFPLQKGRENLIVLEPDKFLQNYGLIAPLPQLYVDLWNLPEWYAKDFLEALKKKMF